MKANKWCVAVITAGVAIVATSALAQTAGLQAQMDKMFGQMSTATSPQIINDARRGVITGGALEIRAPVSPPATNALNFQPPSVSAGCSGISLYGGSLSYISGQQIVQEFRTIASNAEGVAFQMALQAMSDELSKEEEWFSKVQQAMSSHLQSSCEIATEADHGLLNLINQSGDNAAKEEAVADGDKSDASAATTADTPSNSIASQEASHLQNIVYGNIVWQALNSQHIGFAFGDGDLLQEEIMSITGSIIVCNPKSDPHCAATPGADGIGMTYLQPTLKLEDLMYGSGEDGDEIWSCDDLTKCMDPRETTWSSPGFLTMVDNELGTNGTSGIVGDLLAGTAPTSQQLAFLQNTGAAGPLLVKVGQINPLAMPGYASAIAAPLALEMARKMVDQMIDTAAASLQGSQNPAAARMLAQLTARRKEIDDEYNGLREDHQFDTDAYNLYRVFAATAPSMIRADPATAVPQN